jgi:predicted flap endonuclease-1-like 5' DNA nuclease
MMLEQIKGWVAKGRASAFSAQSKERRRPGGFLMMLNRLVLLALGGFLLARWLRERQEQVGPPPVMEEEDIPIDRYVAPWPGMEETSEQPYTTTQPSQPDDLTVLEGIGPKISSLLQEAGITTYRQLAETDTGRLEGILLDANLRMADPSTWPEQARLSEGRMQEFRSWPKPLRRQAYVICLVSILTRNENTPAVRLGCFRFRLPCACR